MLVVLGCVLELASPPKGPVTPLAGSENRLSSEFRPFLKYTLLSTALLWIKIDVANCKVPLENYEDAKTRIGKLQVRWLSNLTLQNNIAQSYSFLLVFLALER